MIRFIDLGDQILEGTKQFAFFDTVTDTFECFDNDEAWETWLEFETSFRHEQGQVIIADLSNPRPLSRYKRLFPSVWP